MTAAELKKRHKEAFPNTHFFDRSTMKFFGDTMSNYGVKYHPDMNVYELYRKAPSRIGFRGSAYFDAGTMRICEGKDLRNRMKEAHHAG